MQSGKVEPGETARAAAVREARHRAGHCAGHRPGRPPRPRARPDHLHAPRLGRLPHQRPRRHPAGLGKRELLTAPARRPRRGRCCAEGGRAGSAGPPRRRGRGCSRR
ncbi:hypothetical protein [Streptomyces sp. NPDC003015]